MRRIGVLVIVALLAFAAVAHSSEEASSSNTVSDFSAEQRDAMKQTEEKFEFQAEVSRLMEILIKYLYSNKEIFLRELISNASDALDKIRFLSLTDSSVLADEPKLEIRVQSDREKKLLVIRDTGVGMTKEELVKHLGTIAKSGTSQFVDAVAAGGDTLSLIGQFGVGFYSVYLVADSVSVASKSHKSDKQYVWESAAQGTFSIAEDPRGNTLGRGTEITIRLKDDAKDFADFFTLKRVATKYSEFINFPIYLEEGVKDEKEVPVEEEATEQPAEEKKDDVEVTEEKKEEAKPKTKKVIVTNYTWHLLNEHKPIWTRNPKEVTDEEYKSFYKALTKDTEEPLAHIHFSAEGDVQFKALLYIPRKAASDLYDKYYGKSSAIKLYVRRVLIAEEFEDFMPRYLSFIKGVVDSDDLPLNVNRETLQKSKLLQVIAKKLVQKTFAMLNSMAEKKAENEGDKTDYEIFWSQFGKSIRLGMLEDQRNAKKLQKLLRFASSTSPDTPVSLQAYVDRMRKSQDVIYYIAGDSRANVEASPFLERLRKLGYEVLYMVEPLDEYVVQQLSEFEGKKLQSITREGVQIGKPTERAKARLEELQEQFKPLCEYLQSTLGASKLEKVIVSNRVSNSPAVLVTSQYGWSANMERIMKAQALGDPNRSNYMYAKRILEINPRHPVIQEMKNRAAAGEDERLKDLSYLLYDAAALNSGFGLEEPKIFGDRVYRLMATGLNLDPNTPVEEEEELEEQDPEPVERSEEDDFVKDEL